MVSVGGIKLQRIENTLVEAGFKVADYGCSLLDATFERENMIFVLKEFNKSEEMGNWSKFQDQINFNVYLKVGNEKKLNIYFILLIKYAICHKDLAIFQRIEKDPYYCRKIIIRNDFFEKDKQKLPFLPIVLDFDKSAAEVRAKTIHEFVQSIVKDRNELEITEKIFDLIEEKRIAERIIEFFRQQPKDETNKT